MALSDFIADLDELSHQAVKSFDAAGDQASLEDTRVEFLGAKNGRLKSVQKQMGSVDKADKPAAGKKLNEVKQQIQAAFETASDRLAAGESAGASSEQFDPTLPESDGDWGSCIRSLRRSKS